MRVLLNSGGLDSSALALWLRPDMSVTIDYGQPAFLGELRAARSLCTHLGLSHEVLKTSVYSGSPESDGYWPFRNQLLITSVAAHFGWSDQIEIYIGILRDDVYSDCTPKFIEAINYLFKMQKKSVVVSAPALEFNCAELLAHTEFPMDYVGITFSCHCSDLPCGDCRGCRKNADHALRLSSL